MSTMTRALAMMALALALSAQAQRFDRPLAPNTAASVTITVGVGSAATTLVGTGSQVMISNAGTVPIFFNFGDSTVTAAVATGTPVLAGAIMVFTKPAGATHIGTISGTASQTVYVTTGEGD